MTDLDECVDDVQKIVDDAVAEMEREIGRDLESDELEALVAGLTRSFPLKSSGSVAPTTIHPISGLSFVRTN